jgi:hypothetical protein
MRIFTTQFGLVTLIKDGEWLIFDHERNSASQGRNRELHREDIHEHPAISNRRAWLGREVEREIAAIIDKAVA